MPHRPTSRPHFLRAGVLVSLGWAALALALGSPLHSAFAQETGTASPSATPSPTPTGSVSPTHTGSVSPSPTGSVSPTHTGSVSPSPTGSLTLTPQTPIPSATGGFSPTPAATQTPPLLPSITPFPTLPLLPTPTGIPTVAPVQPPLFFTSTPGPPTATLLPFPEITYQYSQRTPTVTLLALQATLDERSLPKGVSPVRRTLTALTRAAPLLLLGGLWLGLVGWFLISQWLIRRK